MPFTPVESSLGGLLIGSSVAAYLYLNGRISGISGIVSGFYEGLFKPFNTNHDWRIRALYLLGLISGSIALKYQIAPQVFASHYTSTTLTSILLHAIAGVFVGMGTYLGSGCTSGHMLCGMARLSPRSIIATLTFCAVAFITTKIFGTVAIANAPFEEGPFMTLPSLSYTLFLLLLVAAVFIIYYLLISNAAKLKENQALTNIELFSSFFNAFVFALGLGISGMTLPSKVLGFFDIGGRHWDPSLVCVAIFAMMTNMWLFQKHLLHLPVKQQPVFSLEWKLPTAKDIDFNLIAGAVLFGVGWGLAGICPGPAVLNIVDMRLDMLAFWSTYIVGLTTSIKLK